MYFLSVCTKEFEDCEVGKNYRTSYWENDSTPYVVYGTGMTKEVYDKHFSSESQESIDHRNKLVQMVEYGIEKNIAIAKEVFNACGMQMDSFEDFVKVCKIRRHLINAKVFVEGQMISKKAIKEKTDVQVYSNSHTKEHVHFMWYATHQYIIFDVWGNQKERFQQQHEYLEQILKLDGEVVPFVKTQYKHPLQKPNF